MRRTIKSFQFSVSRSFIDFYQICLFSLLFLFSLSLIPWPSLAEIIPADRLVNWKPGIADGIPSYPVDKNAKTDYGAVGDGVADDTGAIQNCINNTAVGHACFLPAGTYKITAGLKIPSQKVLRGNGPAYTRIINASTTHPLTFSGAILPECTGLVAAPRKGETSLALSDYTCELSSSSSMVLANGDYILISEGLAAGSGKHNGEFANDTLTDTTKNWTPNAFVGYTLKTYGPLGKNSSDDKTCTITGNTSTTVTCSGSTMAFNTGNEYRIYPGSNPYHPRDYYPSWITLYSTQILKITSLDTVNNSVTIDRPMYATYDLLSSPRIRKFAGMVYRSGVEDLYVETAALTSGVCNFLISGAIECWLKNIESSKSAQQHVRMSSSARCVIRDSFFHESWNYESGSGYGIHLYGANSDHLIENNIFAHLRHSVAYEGSGNGNVVSYNYSIGTFGHNPPATNDTLTLDLMNHGGYPYHNLFEGNIGQQMGEDNVWGGSRYQTWLRNYATRHNPDCDGGDCKYGLRAFRVEANNLYSTYVGNVACKLGDTGQVWHLYLGCDNDFACNGPGPIDTRVAATILRHGNFDFISNTTQWDPNITDHNLPKSLYLETKPSFFGDLPWPPIGPDISGIVGTLPAKLRYEGSNFIKPPTGFKIQ